MTRTRPIDGCARFVSGNSKLVRKSGRLADFASFGWSGLVYSHPPRVSHTKALAQSLVFSIMAPKHTTAKKASRPGQRGESSNAPKKDANKKKSSRQKPASEAPPAPEPHKAHLEAMTELMPPVKNIADGLRERMGTLQEQLDLLKPPQLEKKMSRAQALRLSATAEAEVAPASAPAAASSSEPVEDQLPAPQKRGERRDSLRVWKSFASLKLADMATSLDAALVDDSKLRLLFDQMDLDLGGSIDREELRYAIRAAGKDISEEMIDRMVMAADADGNGGARCERAVLASLLTFFLGTHA